MEKYTSKRNEIIAQSLDLDGQKPSRREKEEEIKG